MEEAETRERATCWSIGHGEGYGIGHSEERRPRLDVFDQTGPKDEALQRDDGSWVVSSCSEGTDDTLRSLAFDLDLARTQQLRDPRRLV